MTPKHFQFPDGTAIISAKSNGFWSLSVTAPMGKETWSFAAEMRGHRECVAALKRSWIEEAKKRGLWTEPVAADTN